MTALSKLLLSKEASGPFAFSRPLPFLTVIFAPLVIWLANAGRLFFH